MGFLPSLLLVTAASQLWGPGDWAAEGSGSRWPLPTSARGAGLGILGILESEQLSLSSRAGTSVGGRWRAWAQGHKHRVSFHLCKDSLTPEHINILNDSERSWDSRRPSPSPPPRLHLSCPLPSRLTLPSSFSPDSCPLSPSHSLSPRSSPLSLLHSCLPLSFPLPSSPLGPAIFPLLSFLSFLS